MISPRWKGGDRSREIRYADLWEDSMGYLLYLHVFFGGSRTSEALMR